jgi:spore germination cell wall hydrolase CwlJ-like protein
MFFLFNKVMKCFAFFLMVIMFTKVYAEINAFKPNNNTGNYFKTVTMQPISDDDDDDTINAADNSDMTYNVSANNDYSESELKCLTQTIYFEARGESYEGGVAVGNVMINRVKSPKFPKTICGVMRQKTGRMCQFSFMCNGQINHPVQAAQWTRSKKIALDILNGTAPKLSNGALFFHAKYAKLRMASSRYTAKIGQHYFYK